MSTSRFAIGATTLLVAAALAGCAAEPSAAPSEEPTSPTASASITADPTLTPTPSATADADDIALPTDCMQAYSAAMLASLEQEIPPLNDPGVTMYSTENATLLETLEIVPTLRCSWGVPSEVGMATNISIVDAAQSSSIVSALAEAGFGCADEGGATICRVEQRGVTLDDAEYTRGETHALRGDVWVSTAWLNFAPDGYTEDILTTLWG